MTYHLVIIALVLSALLFWVAVFTDPVTRKRLLQDSLDAIKAVTQRLRVTQNLISLKEFLKGLILKGFGYLRSGIYGNKK